MNDSSREIDRMIRVGIFSEMSAEEFGGIVSYCKRLCLLMNDAENGLECEFVGTFEYRRLRFFNKRIIPSKALKKTLLQNDFDVIHVNGFMTFFAAKCLWLLRHSDKKVVYTPHSHPFRFLNHPFVAFMFFHLILRPRLRYADAIVTINNEEEAFYKKIYSGLIVKIPHWSEKKSVESTMSRQENSILFVGRNDSNKRLDFLYSLPSKYHVHCVTTKKPDRDDFIFYTDISDEELSSLYSECALTVIPSRYEAFSYVALESLVHGTPVLCSSNVRIADFVGEESGLTVFSYDDFSDFLEKIEPAMSRKVNSEAVSELFGQRQARDAYFTLYQKVGGKR